VLASLVLLRITPLAQSCQPFGSSDRPIEPPEPGVDNDGRHLILPILRPSMPVREDSYHIGHGTAPEVVPSAGSI
jgi:hypothetical protein